MIKRIVLDLDDTLCSFCSSWGYWMYEQGYSDVPVKLKDINSYTYFMDEFGQKSLEFFQLDPHFTYQNYQKPFRGSHEFIEWCKRNFDDVMVCSHADSDAACDAKKEFVRHHYRIDNIVFSGRGKEKHHFTCSESVLVDDHPGHLLKHIHKHNSPAICFNRYNQNGWSNLTINARILNTFKPNLDLYYKSDGYETTKRILESL